MKFVHAADIHLDSPLRGLQRYEGAPVGELRNATRRAFENLVSLCLDENVDFLLIAGDLYDGDWQDYNTGLFLAKQMCRLREAAIPVYVIRGNHDAESKITRQLRFPDNVHSFGAREAETVRLEHLGVALHGRSFATQAMTENLSLSYPRPLAGFFNIGLLHTSADGRPGHERYAPCSRHDLAVKGYDYWALGHIHQREVLCAGKPWIVFPGNLQGRHVRETGEKGCTLVTLTGEADHVDGDDDSVEVEHRTLDVVRWSWCTVDAARSTSVDDLLAQVRTALETVLQSANGNGTLFAVRLTFQGPCAVHRVLASRPEGFVAELRSLANELGNVWIERVEFETHASLDLDAVAQGADPLGQLVRFTRDLKSDEAGLKQLAGEFQDLRRKLPAELHERIFPEETVVVRELLGDIEHLLVARLLAAGAGDAG
ncbi:MAG: DNA repair exonuclease [Verrucomicrobia bacterium]|nr:DNA repair exonuclease [Verrucomicrobiota bacterium]